MIVVFLLQATLGAIGQQALPPSGCAAYLWSRSEPPQLVAMMTPGAVRLSLDGKTADLPRTGAEGAAARGLPATSRYAAGDTRATLEMSAVERPDLADGAVVPQAVLTVEQPGKDVIVAPAAGLIGCARPR